MGKLLVPILLDAIVTCHLFRPNRGREATFKALCELYAASLARDPNYNQYLTKIGELHFGVKPPARRSGMGGIFGNLLQSLMEDNDDSDDGSMPPTTHSQPPVLVNRRTVEDDLD